MAKKEMLKPGDMIPDVTLTGPDGAPVRLRERLGKNALVIYFYPKDETPGCTAESCSFRDHYQEFLDAGADVIGISGDSVASHQKFAAHHRLPFALLSDETGAARSAFGVRSLFGLLPGRVTFVADREGKIRYVFNSQLRPVQHVSRALEIVRSLGAPQAASSAPQGA